MSENKYENIRLPNGVNDIYDCDDFEKIISNASRRRQDFRSREMRNYHKKPRAPYISTILRPLAEDDCTDLHQIVKGAIDALELPIEANMFIRANSIHRVSPISDNLLRKIFQSHFVREHPTLHDAAMSFNKVVEETSASRVDTVGHIRLGAMDIAPRAGINKEDLVVISIEDRLNVIQEDRLALMSRLTGRAAVSSCSAQAPRFVLAKVESPELSQPLLAELEDMGLSGRYLTLDDPRPIPTACSQ